LGSDFMHKARKGLPFRRRSQRRQSGATLVEFSLTLAIFFLVVLAIFEFVLMVLAISRANEATRDMARIAIVSDPVCNIWGTDCPGGVPLSCPGGPAIVTTLAGATACTSASTGTACRMLNRAQTHIPDINGAQIEVRYGCSGTSLATRPEPVPLVTVALRNVTHALMVPGLLGLNPQLDIPSFETTRIAEDISTSQKRY
jgi:hypothetical protein